MTRQEEAKRSRAWLKERIDALRKTIDYAERNLEERECIVHTKVELLILQKFLTQSLEFCARIEELEKEYDDDND